MTTLYVLTAISLMMVATFVIKLVPFYCIEVFKDHPLVTYLAEVLPAAIMTILVFYSYSTALTKPVAYQVAGIIAGLLIVLIHVWRRNFMLSMSLGMLFYIGIYHVLIHIGI